MRILIFENNLFWSVRIQRALASLGHQAVIHEEVTEELGKAGLAIVNLSWERSVLQQLVKGLKRAGIPILGHAGHKEKELWQLGEELGCNEIVSNSALTHKLPELLKLAKIPD